MSIQVLQDGEKNLVLHVVDEASPFTIDISSFSPNTRHGLPTSIRLDEVKYSTDNDLVLTWDATVDDNLVTLVPSEFNFNWRRQGGLNNPKSAGFTGDVIVTTTSTSYFMTLSFTKKFN